MSDVNTSGSIPIIDIDAVIAEHTFKEDSILKASGEVPVDIFPKHFCNFANPASIYTDIEFKIGKNNK